MSASSWSMSQKLAMGLLAICAMALLVGVFNAIQTTQREESVVKPKAEESNPLKTILGSKALEEDHLMLVKLTGMIVSQADSGGFFAEDSMARIVVRALNQAEEDENVKGVLLFIDSPGGTVGMSQELNAAVKRVREEKPVVAFMADVAASGGYYTAVAADRIVCNPGTITGSIGVIMSTMNLKTLLNDKLGVRAITIKSGKFKDILSPHREPMPEEIALLQDLVDKSYQDFLAAVIDGRTHYMKDGAEKDKRIATIKKIADGRIVLGVDAVKYGLADENGDMEHARELLNKMARERFNMSGKKDLPLEEYTDETSFFDLLGLNGKFSGVLASQGGWQGALARELNPSAFPGPAALPSGYPAAYGSLQPLVPQSMPLSARKPNQPLWILE